MSDLLIRGMEMPKSGFITITVTSDGRVVGNSKKENGNFEYLDNEDIATAVTVPPHGDLIDKQYAYQNTMVMGEHMRKIILKQIDLLPTIIPAEIISENEIKIIDTKGKSNYDPKRRFVIPAEEEST